MIYLLEIRSLVLGVHLGCEAVERVQAQDVAFSVQLRFHRAPKGAQTDEISDSVCYADVSQAVRKVITGREFKLIERLGHAVFDEVKMLAGEQAAVRVEVHKLNPPVADLRNGSVYTVGEF